MSGHDYAIDKAHTIRPPRVGQVLCIGVDATSRGYDISALQWNGVQSNKLGQSNSFYVTLEADGNDIYWAMDSAAAGTNGISDTAGASAGGTPALDSSGGSTCQCARLIAGLPVDVLLDRLVDKTIILKCASTKTATLRIWASSQNTPSATT